MSQANTPNPDELCVLCNVTRVNHGDARHEFSVDGSLRNKQTPPAPKNQPPRVQGELSRDELVTKLSEDFHTNGFLRMVEVLADKGLLESPDILYIFSGFRSDAVPKS